MAFFPFLLPSTYNKDVNTRAFYNYLGHDMALEIKIVPHSGAAI
jgi:hypothetical protein